MEDRTSIIKVLGLPEAFTAVLLIIGLILSLAPYFSGADFGLFKIPQFTDPARRRLKILGPVILLLLIMLFVPVLSLGPNVKSDNINRNNNASNNTDSDNGRSKNASNLTPPMEIRNQVQIHILSAESLYENAKYEEAIKECDKALRLEPGNQDVLKLKNKIEGTVKILEQ